MSDVKLICFLIFILFYFILFIYLFIYLFTYLFLVMILSYRKPRPRTYNEQLQLCVGKQSGFDAFVWLILARVTPTASP